MYKARTLLALLLLVHVAVHPLVHSEPLATAASGRTTASAYVADQQVPAHSCEICRTGNRLVPTPAFSLVTICVCWSPAVPDAFFDFSGFTQLQRLCRAPPAPAA
ncbi:MAG TPA: hypothetical protein VMT28_05795 [Terriglobales bacterium]|nr:hypothetical protein [Terriglobales bacterium]